jgi:hypothetical protein
MTIFGPQFMALVTEYSWFLWPLCLLAGALAAWFLYKGKGKISGASVIEHRLMVISRFFSVSLLCFLLLAPMLKTSQKRVENPVLAIAIDQSSSVLAKSDSLVLAGAIKAGIEQIKTALDGNMEVRVYGFGSSFQEGFKGRFDEKETDIQEVFNQLENRFSNRNLGAAVLISDGIYNKGEDPYSVASDLKFPVYTVGLGDTTFKPDLMVRKVNHNKSAYLGNTYPVEIILESVGFPGKVSTLSVKREEELLYSEEVNITTSSFLKTISLQVNAQQKGLQHLIIEWKPLAGELTTQNNTVHVFVEVIENKQKVLILSAAPHPDISALRQVLESAGTIETDYFQIRDFNQNLDAYHLVILHRLPTPDGSSRALLTKLSESEIPRLIIAGEESETSLFNKLQNVLFFSPMRGRSNEALPLLNNSFSFFGLTEDSKQAIPSWSPLHAPYGNSRLSNGANVLMYQRIGIVDTKEPLVAFNELNGLRTGVIMGEGIWKWRTTNFVRTGNHNLFDDLIRKMVQYLSVKSGKDYFRVDTRSAFKENEDILFHAVVFDPSYQPLPGMEVKLEIADKEKNRFNFIFSPDGEQYKLNAGSLPVGQYQYNAKVNTGEKSFQQSGVFTVNQVNVEYLNTTARHKELKSLAISSGGKYFDLSRFSELAQALKNREDLVPVSYVEKKMIPLIHLKIVFALLLLFLATEWFLRKRSGGY